MPCIARELGELLGSIRGGGNGLEEFVVGAAVVAAYAEAILGDVHGLGGVGGGLLDDVGAGSRGGLRGHVESTG